MSEREKELLEKIAPVINGQKYPFPDSLGSPTERLLQRLAHFNQSSVYMRECSATNKRILSMFSPAVPFPVYDNDYWWSDNWDSISYGRDFDFNKTFFEQWLELRNVVPHRARSENNNENCDYCNNVDHNKNGYLIFNTTTSEDCLYGENVSYCKDCTDCTQCKRSELCYECTLCSDCYSLKYSENCEGCSNSMLLRNCRSLKNCFACVNLYRKEYCIFNQQYSKEDYELYMSGIDFSSYSQMQKIFQKFNSWEKQFPRPHLIAKQIDNATGNILHNVRDVEESFLIFGEGENLVNCFNLDGPVKDCLEQTAFGLDCELMYQCVRCGCGCFNLCFCIHCIETVSNLLYSEWCHFTSDCFGCVGLRRKKYCILNKQYSQEEYYQLVPRIIEHMKNTNEWGQFFPIEMSSIPYNHSMAQRYFPISKSEAKKRGYFWYDREEIDSSKALDAKELPDSLPPSSEALVVKSIISNKPFLITKREINNYKNFHVPLPRLSHEERSEIRAKKLGHPTLNQRICDNSKKVILSAYNSKEAFPIWEKDIFDREFFS